MKKIIMFILIGCLFILPGCGKNLNGSVNVTEQDPLKYQNNNYKFTLQFPESWKDKYVVEENSDGVCVLYKNSSWGKAIFFTINIYKSKEDYESSKATYESIGGGFKDLYNDGKMYFAVTHPSDVQEVKDEYNEMVKDIPNIEKSFSKIK